VVSDCPKEAITQHHLGIGFGHGPVRSDEVVLFAVFESTARDANRLIATAFSRRQLNRGEVSLARLAYTTRATFDQRVVSALENRQGTFLGVACANVRALRRIRFEVPGTNQTITRRAVCVLDKVSPLDHNGHAALEYADFQGQLTERQRSACRQLIHADLADAFSDIISLDQVLRMPPISIWRKIARLFWRK